MGGDSESLPMSGVDDQFTATTTTVPYKKSIPPSLEGVVEIGDGQSMSMRQNASVVRNHVAFTSFLLNS